MAGRRAAKIVSWVWLGWFMGAGTMCAWGGPLTLQATPEPLRPWYDWVRDGQIEVACAFLHGQLEQRRCDWPGRLTVRVDAYGGDFELSGVRDQPGWTVLPGGDGSWPIDLAADRQALVVLARDGRPAVALGKGPYRLHGRFHWQQLPDVLLVPPATALVELTVDGVPVRFPQWSSTGAVWLRPTAVAPELGREAHVQLQVFRKIVDDIPLQLVTRLHLEVSGPARQIQLGPVLPTDFTPLGATGSLPLQMTADGQVVIQARAGSWDLEITAQRPQPVSEVAQLARPAPWPAHEIWSFEARPALRLVEPTGLQSIDPTQTALPTEWRVFPAYLVSAGEALQLPQIRRGAALEGATEITLARDFWLDFDGRGYTVHDALEGTAATALRLELTPPFELGQALLDGDPQLITRASATAPPGIAVRQPQFQVTADSRYAGDVSRFHPVGWQHDVQNLELRMHLPPGWRLLSARGMDQISDSWLARWTLLDVFLVLIVATAIGRLWQPAWGVLAAITLALTWHSAGAPQQLWLHVVVAVALVRVAPPGSFRRMVLLYRAIAATLLVLMVVAFTGVSLRDGLFPQLSSQSDPGSRAQSRAFTGVSKSAPATALQRERQDAERYAEAKASDQSVSPPMREVDPDAKIQTGPGVPRWHWHTVALGWTGPVNHQQSLRLWLLPPRMNLVLAVVQVGLLLWLTARLVVPKLRWPPARQVVWLLAFPAWGVTPDSWADFPPQELLDELRKRVLAAPDCAPRCAEFADLQLDAQPEQLDLRLTLHAGAETAVPLPGGQAADWVPQRVELDGARPAALLRERDGSIWLRVTPGVHTVRLSGVLPPRDSLAIPLPLQPQRVSVMRANGWAVEGIDLAGRPTAVLQLTRHQPTQTGQLEGSAIPPFAMVQRTVQLGTTWRVETMVTRRSPTDQPWFWNVPLLPGEAVVDETIKVLNHQAEVAMPAGVTTVRWQSTLPKHRELRFRAPASDAVWQEVWRVTAAPMWHLEVLGEPPAVYDYDNFRRWIPEWRPWPNETLVLQIHRPEAVAGATQTIDHSRLTVTPGQRAIQVDLAVELRASLGGQRTVRLSEDAIVQQVHVDGRVLPVRPEQGVLRLPVRPGAQQVLLQWLEPRGLTANFRTPQVDLGGPSVNAEIVMHPSADRWLLWFAGPRLGPALLFWPLVATLGLAAVGLGWAGITPLRARQWLLLLLGLTQSAPWIAVLVVGWFWLLRKRSVWCPPPERRGWFNAAQVGLVVLTVMVGAGLLDGVRRCLLGAPQMWIAGNDSDAHGLRWYQDLADAVMPTAQLWSLPLWTYRVLALCWALWLAFSAVSWSKWAWRCYSQNGLWRPAPAKSLPDPELPPTEPRAE